MIMMGSWGRIALIAIALTAGAWSDKKETGATVACSSLKIKTRECNPYQMILVPAERNSTKPATIHKPPVTQKTLPKVERGSEKRTVRINTLLDNYVEKQDQEREEQEHLLEVKRLESEQGSQSPTTKAKWLKVPKGVPLPSARASMKFVSDDLALIDEILGTPEEDDAPKSAAPTIRKKVITPAVSRKPSPAVVVSKPVQGSASHQQPKTKAKETGYYRVEKGDSLLWISKKFSMTLEELSLLNSLERKGVIRIGQKLRIPKSQREIDIIVSGEYKVENGDSLLGIAKRFDVSLGDLMKLNKIDAANHIRIGQKLTLPLPHKLAEIKRAREEAERKRLEAKREKERQYRLAIIKRERKKLRASDRKRFKRSLWVQATAYTSHVGQTDKTPFLAAWNNRIRPGMKIIAVSHDLIRRYGITNGVRVKISGLKGVYTVRDKMNRKWRRKIDIYMGTNRRKALRWGRRRVILFY